jgi:hypothetical protein
MLLQRINRRGPGQMPPVGSNVIDTQGVALVTAWINSLTPFQTLAEWQIAHWGSTNHPDAAPSADPDQDGGDNRYERLTRTSPTNHLDVWAIDLMAPGAQEVVMEYQRLAEVGFTWQTTTNPASGSWEFLGTPGNRVWYHAEDQVVRTGVPTTNAAMFRLQLHEL